MDSDDTSSNFTPLIIPASKDQLEDEFRKILLSVKFAAESDIVTSTTATDPQYIESDPKSDQIEGSAVHDLRRVTDLLISAGYSLEHVADVYATVRKNRLDAICENLDWQIDEDTQTRRWTHAAKIAAGVLFPCERKLFGQVFEASIADQVIDARFVEIVGDSALRLLRFMEAVISNTKAPHNLFQILDLYQFLSDSLPEIRKTFGSKSGEVIINQAENTLSILSKHIRDTLLILEKIVIEEKSTTPVPGGSVHPFTRYVMSYIVYLAHYEQTLTKLILSKPLMLASELEIGSASLLRLYFLQIIEDLKSNLEEDKFKCFSDAALGHLFVMNNLHYIVGKIKSSVELTEMIGDDFINKLTDGYKRASDMYRESAWEGILDNLRTDTGFLLSLAPKIVYRHRLKVFNDKFKKARETQSSWVVPDDQLRKDLRASIVDMIVPVYTSFLERHRSYIERGDHPGISISYAVEKFREGVEEIFIDKRKA